MHKGWLAAGGNHPVCIRFKKSNEKSTEYVYNFVFLLGIYTGQTYVHSVYMRCGFPQKIHAQYVCRFLGKPVYIQVALYVYGQSLHPGCNIYILKKWQTYRKIVM